MNEHSDSTLSGTNRAGRRSRRRMGYVLIAVLGLTAVITTLGLSFLSSNGTAMPESVNRYRAAAARYLAESGIAVGSRFLLRPPTTVANNDYWRGMSNMAVDNSPDFVNITVAQDGTDSNQYLVTSVGTALDYDGVTTAGKCTVRAKVLKPYDAKWRVPYAAVRTSNSSLPTGVFVVGDLHVNGTLTALGWCNGKVTATGLATWLGTGSPSPVLSLQPAYAAPTADPNLYKNYQIYEDTFTATSYNDSKMDAASAVSWNNTNVSSTNPGRILICKTGEFELKDNVSISGTLVVTGDLKFRDNITITAQPNFPALVVTGKIYSQNDDSSLTVLGSVICGNGVKDDGKEDVSIDISGALISGGAFQRSHSSNWIRMTWHSQRSIFWNFSQTATRRPITLLSWEEN